MVRMKQGRLKEAKKQLTEVLESERRLLGEEHELVLGTSSAIMSLYAMQGQSDALKVWCSNEIERLGGISGNNRNAVALRLCMLARIQATYPSIAIRNGSEAIKNAKQACELTNGQDWRCLEALAAAYAEAGDFVSAINLQTKAIQTGLNISVTEAGLLSRRMELYNSNKPYREGLFSLESSCLYVADSEEAEKALIKALEHCRRVFGQQHPETQGCIIALVELYETWGDVEKTEELRKQLLKTEMIRQ
jgi:tetratricopeptide (TPR) repeat protein